MTWDHMTQAVRHKINHYKYTTFELGTHTRILKWYFKLPTSAGSLKGGLRQVLRAGALGRPRGMGWRGRQERASGWGTHVNPWLIHVNVWQKPLQYCKVISLQLIKINGKKKKKEENSRKPSISAILTLPKSLIVWITINCGKF